MNRIQGNKKRLMVLLSLGTPAAVAIVATLLPLKEIVRQSMIGIILVWFQISLMLGVFTNES
jgi:hypothetical protein